MQKSKFKCENCLMETKIGGEGRIKLICQSCGCFDIQFDTDVLVFPYSQGDIKTPTLVKAKEPFFGRTKDGSIWHVAFAPDGSKEDGLEIVHKTPVLTIKPRIR